MTRAASLFLCLALTLPLCGAQATSSWRAWSDQSTLPAFADHEKLVAESRAQACWPHVRDPTTPGLATGGGRDIDELIRDLERLLASMKPGDQGYEGIMQSLQALKKQNKQGSPPLATGNAPGALSFQAALARVEQALAPGASRVSARASADDVVAALAAGSQQHALALLLASHRAAPKQAWTLVNAAGVLSLTGFAREAIAFLDEATRLGGALPAPAGVPGQAIALSNRGHALLGLGRWSEAAGPLRAALKLAPDLAEAHTNLSQALLCQGQTGAATRELRLGLRRTPPTQASPEHALEETVPGRHGAGVKPVESAPTRRPARELFDLSRGVTFDLPALRLPTNRREAIALGGQYYALGMAGAAEIRALTDQAAGLLPWSKLDAGERAWASLVQEAIVNAHFEPELWSLYKAAWDAHYAFVEAAPRFAQQRNAIEERARSVRGCGAQQAVYDEAAQVYLDGLRPFVRGQEQAMARLASARVRHETALAANVADPALRRSMRLDIEARAKSLYYGPVVDSAWIMSQVETRLCEGSPAPVAALGDTILPELSQDPCGGLPTGGKLKSKVPSAPLPFGGYGLSLGVSCKGLDIELSPSVKAAFGAGPFAQLSLGWSGAATVFAGLKAEFKPPKGAPLAGYNKSGLSVKEGFYLKFGRKGLVDAGFRVEAKAAVGAGPDKGAGLWEGRIEQEFGVAAAAAYWRER